ncbi:Pyocin-S2 [Pseudomonas aeruginosa]|uniref:S-type pyocin domain-containing protein n=1 Tax=Pseudomonas aeruginosa TaxID=287 RepID=UPI000E07F1D0|nr:S-type pyocin domain-containing protein [Pseudomonas aeruginosa]RCN15761.1 Pyocin-S2 [Pseudomonas aeruginosa]
MSDVFDLGSMTTVATATGQYSFYTPPPPTPIPYLTYIARPGINKFDLPEGAKIKDLIKRYQYERSQVLAAIMIRGVQEEIKKSTNTALANVGSIVDGELAYLASQKKEKLNPTGATPLQMATAEKAAAVELLASKQKELADARTIANAFFGYDPLTVNYVNVMNEIYGRREDKDFSFDNWSKSYSAAQKIRLIEAEISVLNSRSSALDGKVAELTRLQRLEDAQRAAEAARQTEAERLAQEQRQAEARRQAEEARRQAEAQQQAELQRLAEAEAKRVAEAEKKRQDEINARLQAIVVSESEAKRIEEIYKRLEEQDKISNPTVTTPPAVDAGSRVDDALTHTGTRVTSGGETGATGGSGRDVDTGTGQGGITARPVDVSSVSIPDRRDPKIPDQPRRDLGALVPTFPDFPTFPSFPGVGVPVAPKPLAPAGGGAASVSRTLKTAVDLLSVARKPPGAMLGQVAAVIATMAVSSFWPKLNNGERQASFAIPVAELSPPLSVDWQAIAAAKGTVDLPYRLKTLNVDGSIQIIAVPTEPGSAAVPVRALTLDSASGTYKYTTTGPGGGTILVTPDTPPGQIDPSSSTPAVPHGPLIMPGTLLIPKEPQIESYPELEQREFNDGIYVYPEDSGIPPLYIVYRDPRDEPGVATGNGQPVTGNWLAGASQGNGVPIPSQIADQLRGKEFKSWRDFREQFWMAVSKDPSVLENLSPSNRYFVSQGLAPYAVPEEHLGSKEKFEIHHVVPLESGGALYNTDNLVIVTPKRHSEIHKELKFKRKEK